MLTKLYKKLANTNSQFLLIFTKHFGDAQKQSNETQSYSTNMEMHFNVEYVMGKQ